MAIDVARYKATGEKVGKRSSCSCPSFYDDELILEIMGRISRGEGVREMAREYNIPKSTVSNWVNGHYRTEVTGGSLYDLLEV